MAIEITLLVTSVLLLASALPPPPSCTDQLVAFSPCLGYASLPPNNLTDAVTDQCCNALANAFADVEGNCFCYLTKQPLIFGFPLNVTKVISLPSICASLNASLAVNLTYLGSVCSGSRALPPLRSARGSAILAPLTSAIPDNGPSGVQSPPESRPLESDNAPTMPTPKSARLASPPPFRPIPVPLKESSSAKHTSVSKCFYPPGVIAAIVIFILQ